MQVHLPAECRPLQLLCRGCRTHATFGASREPWRLRFLALCGRHARRRHLSAMSPSRFHPGGYAVAAARMFALR
jgi:hypothetical protein